MKFRNGFCVVGISIAFLLTATFEIDAQASKTTKPIHQLRIYEIFENNKKAFHDRFRDHAARIMVRYDFKIVAMWESKGANRTEFVYILEWPDAATMKDRWTKFMADKEWADIKKATGKNGPLVGDIADRTLELTGYSPQRSLLRRQ